MVTGREIARLAGVSQATVSRVVQGAANVTDETRARVEKVMHDVGYVPNAQARAMRTRRSGVIGVVTGQITNPWYPLLLETLAGYISRAGLQMNVWVSDGDISDHAAIEAIRARLVDGLIFTTATRTSSALPAALDIGLPVVLVNRSLEGVPGDQVISDNLAGGRAVARYFIDNGRTDVAIVGGRPEISTGFERRRGFLDEFEKAGIPIPPERMPESDFVYAAGLEAGRRILSSNPPQAVFCATDVTAFGVMDAAKGLGIRVPEDLWVVGYDDIPMASWDVLSLTTVRQPMDAMARTALETLLTRIETPSAPYERRRFPPELIVRGSTAYAR